jgi:hypothetical protein
VVVTEACGIAHETTAVLVGVDDDGFLHYRAEVRDADLRDAEITIDALPPMSTIEVVNIPD